MAPLFSIVIPTYNRARRVAAAVRSVLAQAETAWECFVVDDGSNDETKQTLSQFLDPRIKFVFNNCNRGQHACRNQAIGMAQAPWIAFLDSDDLYLPQRLAVLREAIEGRPSVGFWFTNAYVWRFDRVIGTVFDSARSIPEGRVPGWYAISDRFLPYVTTTAVIRREAFHKTGLFREDLRILEDTELYSRMLAGGLEVGSVRRPLAVRFLHEEQITRDYRKDFEEALEALRSSGAPPDEAARVRENLVLEVAEYLWRDLQPGAARQLLEHELPGRRGRAYWQAFAPSSVLGVLKKLRAGYLWLRHHPALAGSDRREVSRFVSRMMSGAA